MVLCGRRASFRTHPTERTSITVATISWARTSDEASLLERSLRQLADTGLSAVVADRGTNPTFTDSLRRLPRVEVVVPGAQGLVPQVSAAVEIASRAGTPFVLYVEPDKEEFFATGLRDFIRRAPAHADGVVLAARFDAAFLTFPPMQRHTEGFFNDLCADVMGLPGDYCYGPFLFHRSLAPHVVQMDPSLGWGWRPSVFVEAHRRGLGVTHVVGDYSCPADQRHEDDTERRHRIRQLGQNLLGLVS